MKTSSNFFDISSMKPDQQCLTIFDRFDELKQGESLILETDQDPVNLYHHLLEVRAEPFEWKRLEDGPLRWQVKVTKSEPEEGALTIGKIAAEDYLKAEVFQRLGIPYCCAGNKTLKEACEEAGIRQEILEQFYEEAARYKAKEVYAFEKWETGFLVDYIVRTHHTYVKQNLQTILDLSVTAAREQGKNYPELEELTERLNYFLSGLADHLQKEEQHLFPLIKKLALSKKKNRGMIDPAPAGISAMIAKLEQDHQQAGSDLRFFKKISRNFRLPADAGNSLIHLYAKLLEFENDLVQHIHLENNLLFPKAIALEKVINNHKPIGFVKQIYQAS